MTTLIDGGDWSTLSFVTLFWFHQNLKPIVLSPYHNLKACIDPQIYKLREAINHKVLCSDDCWCHGIESISGHVRLSLRCIATPGQRNNLSFHTEPLMFIRASLNSKASATRPLELVMLPESVTVLSRDQSPVSKISPLKDQNGDKIEEDVSDHVKLTITWSANVDIHLEMKKLKNEMVVNEIEDGSIYDFLFFEIWGRSDDMRSCEILRCQQSQIYNNKYLMRLLPRAKFVPLPSQFVDWLAKDGLNLGLVDPSTTKEKKCRFDSDVSSSSVSDSEYSQDDCSYENSNEYLETCQQMENKIKDLGGEVFPKLNWSGPKDAKWMLGNRLLCTTAREVLLLLKSSAWIAHDLDKAFERVVDCPPSMLKVDYQLCLKESLSFKEGMEFRSFYWNRKLLGVSQRDNYCAFEFICDHQTTRNIIKNKVSEFFRTKLYPAIKFQGDDDTTRGAFDVFFVDRDGELECNLLDISPWGATTDPLLFDWNELREIAFTDQTNLSHVDDSCSNNTSEIFEFKYVSRDRSGKRQNSESYQRLPQDFYENKDASDVVEWLRLVKGK